MIHHWRQGTLGGVLLTQGAGCVLPSPPLLSTPSEHFLLQNWGGLWTVRSKGSTVYAHVPLLMMPLMNPDPRAPSPAEGAVGTQDPHGNDDRDSRQSPAFVTRTEVRDTERLGPALWLLVGPPALLDHFGPHPAEETGHQCHTLITKHSHKEHPCDGDV